MAPISSTLATIGAVWLLTGILLRLTGWRDRFDGFSVIYYTTPWLVAAVGWSVIGIEARLRKLHRRALISFSFAIGSGLAWSWTSWYSNVPLNSRPDLRVVFWNVRNDEDDLQEFASRIRAFSPDIVALAEAGNNRSNIEQWRQAFPEYTVDRLPQQMLTMSRSGLTREKSGSLASGSFFGIHSTQIGDRTMMIVQADLDARPFRSRRKAIHALTKQVRKHSGQSLLLLGDFNTPHQSWHLDPMRQLLRHAFETRGSGLADTWPLPLPVLSLDQVWFSSDLEVVSCRQGWSTLSDHRPVFVELRFK